MGMTADDNPDAGRLGFQIELLYIVQDIERHTVYNDECGRREVIGPWAAVCVSPHRSDRCNRRERIENFRFADITGMNDQVGAGKSIDCPGIKISVSVGYDADTKKTFPQRSVGHFLPFLFSVVYRLNVKQIQIFDDKQEDMCITI